MSGVSGRAGVRECLVASAPAALTARAIRGVDLAEATLQKWTTARS